MPYIFENFSLERAIEINDNILHTASTLSRKPGRGRKEKYLEDGQEEFKFILHKESKHFEIKIIYFIDAGKQTVNITDFFPTRMDPQKMRKNK